MGAWRSDIPEQTTVMRGIPGCAIPPLSLTLSRRGRGDAAVLPQRGGGTLLRNRIYGLAVSILDAVFPFRVSPLYGALLAGDHAGAALKTPGELDNDLIQLLVV